MSQGRYQYMPFCQFCGSQLNEIDKFCCICGKPVIVQQSVGNPFNQGQNFNQNNFITQAGNPPIFSQPEGFSPKPIQQGFTQQTLPNSYPEQNFPNHNLPSDSNLSHQVNKEEDYDNNLKKQINPLEDDFHKKIWEFAKDRGWIDKEQPIKEDLWLNINGELYIYPLLQNDGSLCHNFTLIKGISEFKKKHSEIIIQLILNTASSTYISRLSAETQQIGFFKSFNQITATCVIPKKLINDVSLAFDIALKDMKELGDRFLSEFNNQIKQ